MSASFYAVKRGKVPGIYETWSGSRRSTGHLLAVTYYLHFFVDFVTGISAMNKLRDTAELRTKNSRH